MPTFNLDSIQTSQSGEGSETSYVDPSMLPGDRVDRTGNDEIAAKAFTAACSAMGGPQAGMVCDWYTHGGAEWIQNAIMSLLPSEWKAQGIFDWVSYVIEPIRKVAMQQWQAQLVASKNMYRLMLEQQGIVKPDEWTPAFMQWEQVRGSIKGVGTLDFDAWCIQLANEHFRMNEHREAFDGKQGFAIVRSVDECRAINNGLISWTNYFCTKLDGISGTPEQADVERLGKTLQSLYGWARLKPLQDGITLALDAAQVAAVRRWDGLHNLGGAVRRFQVTPTPPPRAAAVAAFVSASLACGILGTTWYFTRRR